MTRSRKGADFPPLKTLDVLPNNLPIQLTSFIGREREKAKVRRLLSTTRFLTGILIPADEDAIADALHRLPGAPPGRERARNLRWEITAQKTLDTLAGTMNPVPKALAD